MHIKVVESQERGAQQFCVAEQSAPKVLGSEHEGFPDDVSDGAGAAGLGDEAESGVGSMGKENISVRISRQREWGVCITYRQG